MRELFKIAVATLARQIPVDMPDREGIFAARHQNDATGVEDVVIIFATGHGAAEIMRVLRANSLSFDSPDTIAGKN